jgi:hypothetical protein
VSGAGSGADLALGVGLVVMHAAVGGCGVGVVKLGLQQKEVGQDAVVAACAGGCAAAAGVSLQLLLLLLLACPDHPL